MVYVVMGVSGSGKTTIGKMLAEELNLPFYDADDFHPIGNIEKMKSGEALTDTDRRPWLETLSSKIEKWNRDKGAVLSCSALKKSYRRILMSRKTDDILLIYLKGSRHLILNRLKQRKDHYMPPSLLDSQFEALEEPKQAVTIPIDGTPDQILNTIMKKLKNDK